MAQLGRSGTNIDSAITCFLHQVSKPQSRKSFHASQNIGYTNFWLQPIEASHQKLSIMKVLAGLALSASLLLRTTSAQYSLNPNQIPRLTLITDYTFHALCDKLQNPDPFFDESVC